MVFSSLVFLFYFLPAVLILYYLAPRKGKNAVLFLASLIFYAWGEPVYLFLMLASILINYLLGIAMDAGAPKKKRLILIAACAVNLLLLGFFKYANFLIANFNQLLSLNLPSLNLPLPLGISFYTFQAMSYLMDLYRGETTVQRNFIAFGTYVALFPQLIAGPIVRFRTIAKELTWRRESLSLFSQGALRFTTGLGKKVILANGAGAVFDQVLDYAEANGGPGSLSALTAWIGILAFTFQIYYDFSGYSDMAVGLGRMFGFHFPENFRYPYTAKSITDFWRRWHMTLGTWFREYVYIPLGGNRKGMANQIRNIAVVWLLTGIWHGASWNFVLWGAYFGLLLIVEKCFLLNWLDRIPAAACHLYTMFLVVISWVIFSMEDLSAAGHYLRSMLLVGSYTPVDDMGLYLMESNFIFSFILIIGCTPLPRRIGERLPEKAVPWLQSAGIAAVLLLVCAGLISSAYNPFLYFRF